MDASVYSAVVAVLVCHHTLTYQFPTRSVLLESCGELRNEQVVLDTKRWPMAH